MFSIFCIGFYCLCVLCCFVCLFVVSDAHDPHLCHNSGVVNVLYSVVQILELVHRAIPIVCGINQAVILGVRCAMFSVLEFLIPGYSRRAIMVRRPLIECQSFRFRSVAIAPPERSAIERLREPRLSSKSVATVLCCLFLGS